MKTIKWHKGVKNMVSKKLGKKNVNDLMVDDGFSATKSNFVLLATRAGLDNWKAAVDTVVNKSERNSAKQNLIQFNSFWINKTELRRAADLI